MAKRRHYRAAQKETAAVKEKGWFIPEKNMKPFIGMLLIWSIIIFVKGIVVGILAAKCRCSE